MSNNIDATIYIILLTIALILLTQLQQCASEWSVNKQNLNESCSFDSQCYDNVVCGNGKCICKLGFEPYAVFFTQWRNCLPFRCKDSIDDQNAADRKCVERFGNYTKCTGKDERYVYEICTCDVEFAVEHDSQKCVANKTLIGGDCINDYFCGVNVICGIGNKCLCMFGNVPNSNQVNCDPFKCKIDSDCQRFGSSTTKCQKNNECVCVNDLEFEVDDKTQKCVLKRKESSNRTFWIILSCSVGLVLLIVIITAVVLISIKNSKNRVNHETREEEEQVDTNSVSSNQIQDDENEVIPSNEETNQRDIFESTAPRPSSPPPPYSASEDALENDHANESNQQTTSGQNTRDYANCVNYKARHML